MCKSQPQPQLLVGLKHVTPLVATEIMLYGQPAQTTEENIWNSNAQNVIILYNTALSG